MPEDLFAGYAGAVNPTYITLSRRAHRDRFVSEVTAKNHGSLFSKLANPNLYPTARGEAAEV